MQDTNGTQKILEFLQKLKASSTKPFTPTQIDQNKFQTFKSITKDITLSKAKVCFIKNRIFHLSQLASKLERSLNNLTSNSFSYGEISFESIAKVFSTLKEKSIIEDGGIFYDLGSGSGKGVLAASLLHTFERCIGIEMLESLYKISLQLKEKLLIEQEYVTPIDFEHADLIQYDWSDGTFIFASATCYDPLVMEKMCEKSLLLKAGTIFVTLTKKIKPEEHWQVIDQFTVLMSWGEATLYIQRKKEQEDGFKLQQK